MITYNHVCYLGNNDTSFVRSEALISAPICGPSRSVLRLSIDWHRPTGFSPVIQTGVLPLRREYPRNDQLTSTISVSALRRQSDCNS